MQSNIFFENQYYSIMVWTCF